MSRELKITYNGAAANLYAIIRRTSDDYVWNGSAFAAWADGSIANYDLPMTDRGGDEYTADFPTAITAGDYRIGYYERAGATPAITDDRLATDELHWNGVVATDPGSATLDAYALATLAGVKRHLRIEGTDDDELLTEQINQVSALIERVCGRQFKARDYRERHNAARQITLVLEQWPVISINRMAYGAGNALSVTFTGTAVRANCGASDTGVRLVSVSSAGVTTANTLLFADYPSVSLMVAAINAITGWSATTLKDGASADLNPIVSEDAIGHTVWFTYPDLDEFSYTCDNSRGIIEFSRSSNWLNWAWHSHGQEMHANHGRPHHLHFPRQFQGLLIEYRAGYETVPADVDLACRELVAEKWYASKANPNVKQSNTGPYSATFRDYSEHDIRLRLANYINARSLISGA